MEKLYDKLSAVAGNSGTSDTFRQLQKDFQRRRHYRIVGNIVLFRFYPFSMPHDAGWADTAAITRSPAGDHKRMDDRSRMEEGHKMQNVMRRVLKCLARVEAVRVDEKQQRRDQLGAAPNLPQVVHDAEVRHAQLDRSLAATLWSPICALQGTLASPFRLWSYMRKLCIACGRQRRSFFKAHITTATCCCCGSPPLRHTQACGSRSVCF
ncbi:hypothetical protein ERJ75_001171700 [Trypanosoma vivax]|nr:hypothetical protein ERJ75_001171700 [Trypanosoma vivax]